MFRFTYKFQSQVNVAWLIGTLCGISGLGWLTHFTSPSNAFTIALFFTLFTFTCFGALFYVSNNIRRSLLISVSAGLYLGLRMLGLRDVYYLILLCATVISLELYFQKR